MKPHDLGLLWDAREAAAAACRYLADRDSAVLDRESMVRDAVERQLIILGEALSVLRRTEPAIAARIPEVPRPLGIRNMLVHGYSIVDRDKVRETVERHLPPMIATIDALLAAAEAPTPPVDRSP